MKTLRAFPTLIFFSLIFFSTQSFAFEEWWQCSSRIGGDWTMGRAPFACLVDHMQTQSFVKEQYEPLLFNDNSGRTTERKRYMTELNALAKEVAVYYLNRRKPGVSQEEVEYFTWGLLALMNQETFWSHYRVGSDNRARYMRGDFGHGHGLMQVDDRSHQSHLLQGKGADLIKNMIYGLDVFYAEWQRAPSESCVNGPTDYVRRIRSAWSAYNGGPGRICRWTSSNNSHAQKDIDFYNKLKSKAWENYITDHALETALDVLCLSEGSRPCANTGTGSPTPVTPQEGHLYKVGSGFYCLVEGQQLQCVNRLNDVNCLQARDGKIYPNSGTLSEDQVADFQLVQLDRNLICENSVKGLFPITQEIQLLKRINLRKTPAGELMSTVELNYKTKILDYAVTDSLEQKRYYQITYKGKTGYIYAGDMSSYLEWAKPVSDQTRQFIVNVGEAIEIVAPAGINQRTSPGGALVQRVPNGEKLEVLDRVIQGSENYLYYKVEYNGKVGYLYSGYLTKMSSVADWTIPVMENNFQLASSIPYRYLKSCPQEQCEYSDTAITSTQLADRVMVQSTHQDWSLVQTLDASKQGWVKTSELTPVL